MASDGPEAWVAVGRAHAQVRIPNRFGRRNVRNSFEGEENAAQMRARRHDAQLSRLARTAGEADSQPF
jgi:hypothetical protein